MTYEEFLAEHLERSEASSQFFTFPVLGLELREQYGAFNSRVRLQDVTPDALHDIAYDLLNLPTEWATQRALALGIPVTVVPR